MNEYHVSDLARFKVWNQGFEVVLGEKSGMGRGGMGSKITAALVAANGGVTTCVASGYDLGNIKKIFSGDDVGTLFPGRTRPNKRQRWLTLATGSAGSITVSSTFHETMMAGQDPSLRIGDVISVNGSFPSQSVVSMKTPDGVEFARGIIQKKSAEIKDNLPDTWARDESLTSFNATHEIMKPVDMMLLGHVNA
jgi:glutamate 5-kinase